MRLLVHVIDGILGIVNLQKAAQGNKQYGTIDGGQRQTPTTCRILLICPKIFSLK